jgi:hypothetical protein
MSDVDSWEVSRSGATLRVAVGIEALGHAEEIAHAVERSADDAVDTVRVTGPALDQPRRGLAVLLRLVSDVATEHGKRFQVGPI